MILETILRSLIADELRIQIFSALVKQNFIDLKSFGWNLSFSSSDFRVMKWVQTNPVTSGEKPHWVNCITLMIHGNYRDFVSKEFDTEEEANKQRQSFELLANTYFQEKAKKK